jgi:uncharacterized protein YkwD
VPRSTRGRLSTAALITVGCLALTTSSSASAAGCRGAGSSPSAASPGKLRAAVLCLVNKRRAEHGIGPLRVERHIQKAAGRHARDMLRNNYFAHQRAGGPDLASRLHRAGWSGHAWGENIAYGCGPSATPRGTVRMWMNSPPHRELMLSGTYRQGGVGVTSGAPCGSGAMWVLDVGRQ